MKKLIQTIYGMQYEELELSGKDGNKARFNGNLLVAAYIMVALFLTLILITFIPGYNEAMTKWVTGVFGYTSGKTIGKLLALPLMGGLYYLVKSTIGSEKSFQEHVAAYKQYSDTDKKNSTKRVMIPFMSMLAVMLILSLSRL